MAVLEDLGLVEPDEDVLSLLAEVPVEELTEAAELAIRGIRLAAAARVLLEAARGRVADQTGHFVLRVPERSWNRFVAIAMETTE
jgi:hypothetical protein